MFPHNLFATRQRMAKTIFCISSTTCMNYIILFIFHPFLICGEDKHRDGGRLNLTDIKESKSFPFIKTKLCHQSKSQTWVESAITIIKKTSNCMLNVAKETRSSRDIRRRESKRQKKVTR